MSTPDSRGHTHRPDQTCLYILGSAESCFAFLVNPLSNTVLMQLYTPWFQPAGSNISKSK